MKRREFIAKGIVSSLAFTIVPRVVLGGNGFLAPSDRINLGFIGVGKQSYTLMNGLNHCKEIASLAACDVDRNKLAAFIAATTKKQTELSKAQTEIKAYHHYRELLDRKDIDAVVIATPDHWHAQIAVDAAKAGKDIYCEKPLALTIAEGRAMVDATRKYKRVFQTGSMQRSSYNFRQAAELVLNGYIGKIKEINVSVGEPVKQCDLPSMPAPDYLDWDMWVGPSPYRGYNPILSPPLEDDKWAWWRGYRDFGGGYITDWGAHMFDIVQWALGMDESGPVQFNPPKEANSNSGLSFSYANGVRVNHVQWGVHNAIQFIGEKGKIEVSREFIRSNPENLANLKLTSSDRRLYYSDNHYQDWVDAIKKRSKPICDVEIGHRTSSVCNAINIAYELQKDLKWNPQKEQFDNDYANLMRSRPYRGEWDFRKF
ncbi:oxidoreductase [Sphingobacterium siyangense]|jgi:predicted dehydrogenase|uniref:Gfo/Idh/MocA family oxidoreductase n=2 Tax=Sphingobacterium TaxID=28453 RepID=A0ABX7CIZ8_SPHMU|nr:MULTISPECIES: Gfo/Idh/MocA family oxidoreductase [Sphingobacterium]QQT51971.1 Gfo/Idh/MocA family oxidoreductase [Sphingobacterium multivorum]RKF30062.1 oxidoreductase [Sphingobacterium siyangense]